MSFFKNIYRTEPTAEETLKVNLPDPLFRFSDMLGGSVASRTEMVGKKLGHRGRKAILNDAFRLAFYQLIASGAIDVKVQSFNRVYFGNLRQDSSRIILERNPDFAGFAELDSPLCSAIYAACDGRSIAKVVKLVLNGYMGPGTKHDYPQKVLFSALLQGEMRGWRLQRETTNWGFLKHYEFYVDEEHRELLTDAYHNGLRGLSELLHRNSRIYGVGEDFRRRVFFSLGMRKRSNYQDHHYPRHPHVKPPRRRKKKKRDDDPRMWTEG